MYHFYNLPVPFAKIYEHRETDERKFLALKKSVTSELISLLCELYELGWHSAALSITISKQVLHLCASKEYKSHETDDYLVKQYTTEYLEFINDIKISISKTKKSPIQIYSRINVMSDLNNFQSTSNWFSGMVDVLALHLCDDGQIGKHIEKSHIFDTVILDSIKSAPYVKTRLKQMVRNNIPLEVYYGEAMHDNITFVQFIGRLRIVLRFADMRKNIIFSHAYEKIEDYLLEGRSNYPDLIKFFTPGDVASIATLFGYRFSIGLRCVSEHIDIALQHGYDRCNVKGIAEIIHVTNKKRNKKQNKKRLAEEVVSSSIEKPSKKAKSNS